MVRQYSSVLCLMSLVLWNVGCAPESATPVPLTSDDVGHGHDHGHGHGHEHADTLAGAIEELTELNDGVSAAFAEGDTEAAHGPLHDVGHLMENVSKLAAASELSDEAKASVEKNVDALFELFGSVDKKMHGDEDGKDYKDVSKDIAAAIAAITEAAEPVLSEHDHDGHDHDGEEGHEHEEHGEEHHEKDGDHDGHGDDKEHQDGDKDHDHEDGDEDHDHKEGDDDHKHEEGAKDADKPEEKKEHGDK